jgi:uncharacterized protein YdeI (YjbR/CyaY-like superfamily)
MITNLVGSDEIPMGLGMALAKNLNAMNYFSNLDATSQKQIIEHTHSIRSKEEMQDFVSRLDQGVSIR